MGVITFEEFTARLPLPSGTFSLPLVFNLTNTGRPGETDVLTLLPPESPEHWGGMIQVQLADGWQTGPHGGWSFWWQDDDPHAGHVYLRLNYSEYGTQGMQDDNDMDFWLRCTSNLNLSRGTDINLSSVIRDDFKGKQVPPEGAVKMELRTYTEVQGDNTSKRLRVGQV